MCNCHHCQNAHTTVVSLHRHSLSPKSAVYISGFTADTVHSSMTVSHRGRPSALKACVPLGHAFLFPHRTLATTGLFQHSILFWNVCFLPLTFSVSLCLSALPPRPHTCKSYTVPLSSTTAKGHFPLEMVEVLTQPWFLILKLCLKAAKYLHSSHPCVSRWCSLIDTESQTGHKRSFSCLFCPTPLLKSHREVPSTPLPDSS